LIKKLALIDYDQKAPLQETSREFKQVKLPLKMHIGAPAVPTVKVGDRVTAGQLIAGIPEGKLSAALHASISGKVASVTDQAIVIVRE
jgi:Na+-translocating ferredoxin:NAD+ oxidoreductase RnfC subunit